MKRITNLFLSRFSFLLVCLATTACSTSSDIYYWGQYENLLYKMYNKPGDATPEVQIERLSLDIQQAENRQMPLPPGFYAHLGFMYTANGSISDALSSFEEEKRLYPESEVLIDGMIQRLKQSLSYISSSSEPYSKTTLVNPSENVGVH